MDRTGSRGTRVVFRCRKYQRSQNFRRNLRPSSGRSRIRALQIDHFVQFEVREISPQLNNWPLCETNPIGRQTRESQRRHLDPHDNRICTRRLAATDRVPIASIIGVLSLALHSRVGDRGNDWTDHHSNRVANRELC